MTSGSLLEIPNRTRLRLNDGTKINSGDPRVNDRCEKSSGGGDQGQTGSLNGCTALSHGASPVRNAGACSSALNSLHPHSGRDFCAQKWEQIRAMFVKVQAKGQCRTGRLWTYVRDDQPFGGNDPPAAAYFYSPDHRQASRGASGELCWPEARRLGSPRAETGSPRQC
jgi:hypothetical protein